MKTAIMLLVIYVGCAVAKAPAPVSFRWKVAYNEFKYEDTASRVKNTEVILPEKGLSIAFPKTGWGCGILKSEAEQDIGYPHDSISVGCTREGAALMTVHFTCMDTHRPAEPIIVGTRDGEYQARILVTCEVIKGPSQP